MSKNLLELVGIDFLSMYFRMQQIPGKEISLEALSESWHQCSTGLIQFCFLFFFNLSFFGGEGGIWVNRAGGGGNKFLMKRKNF